MCLGLTAMYDVLDKIPENNLPKTHADLYEGAEDLAHAIVTLANFIYEG